MELPFLKEDAANGSRFVVLSERGYQYMVAYSSQKYFKRVCIFLPVSFQIRIQDEIFVYIYFFSHFFRFCIKVGMSSISFQSLIYFLLTRITTIPVC